MAIRGDQLTDETGLKTILSSFSGGMRRNDDPSVIAENEFVGGINLRVRDGYIKPIKLPLDISAQIPAGKKQGIYGYGTILIVFNDGLAYGIDYSTPNPQFSLVNGFLMSATVDRIYSQDVPSSWFNVQRKADDGADVTGGISIFSEIAGTPAALVCQDGVSQPTLIFSPGNARQAKKETEWTDTELTAEDTREYVPVGRQMMYHPDGLLFILSPDGKVIYRSVTGRPLDFVIAVDVNGHKLPPQTSGKPEAARLSYNLDYTPLTAIYNINSSPARDTDSSGFFVGNTERSWVVFPSFAGYTPFNEPNFRNQTAFSTGPINQDSVAEMLGEVVLITEAGPMTFNAILNTQTEGRNSPFYYKVAALFAKITQTTTCIGRIDDYTLFAVNTIYGQGVLVHDNLSGVFASLDIYENIEGTIKQFATVKIAGIRRLFFITTADKMYEAFASSTTATWKLYTREMAATDTEVELLVRRLRITLANVTENGTLIVREVVDRKNGTDKPVEILANTVINTPPIQFPFGIGVADSVTNKTVTLEKSFKGQRIGLYLSGDFDCELQQIQFILKGDEQATTDTEKGQIYASTRGSN